MLVKGLLPPRGVLKSRSKGSRMRKTHSKSDGVKYSTQQRGTVTITPPRATQSGSCYPNSMRRPQTPHNQISKQPPGRIDDPSTNTERHTTPLTNTTHDPCEGSPPKDGATRSIYGPRKRAPAYNATQQTSEQRGTPSYRGAANPLYFTDEVLDHEFPEGLKPVNIEA